MAGNPTLPTENIDEVILRLLALEPNEVDELDYETYRSYLKELLVEITAEKRKISGGEFELLKNEFKRVRSKKGRFRIRKAKISASGLGLGGIRNQTKKTQQRLMLMPAGGIQQQSTVDTISQDKKTKENPLVKINETLDSILSTLIDINKQEIKNKEKQRLSEEQKKRSEKELGLESKTFDGIKKAISAVTKPFQSIWDKIVNFIFFTLLGRAFVKLMDWFADEKNQGKIKSLIRFVKDWWPALLGSYILFGTKFGGLIRFIGGWSVRLAFQLGKVVIPKLLSLIVKNPVAALAVAGGVGAYAATQQNKERRDADAKTDPSIVKPEDTAKTGVAPGPAQLQQEQIGQQGLGLGFSGGGFANFGNMFKGAGMGSMFGPMGMLLGAALGSGKPQEIISGLINGKKGKDKVPAMLTDGEFVMSVGAVKKYGVDTLEAMNAAGGGTNIPQITKGITYAAGGGMIGDAAAAQQAWTNYMNLNPEKFAGGGAYGTADSVNKASRDFMKTFIKTGNPPAWANINQKTTRVNSTNPVNPNVKTNVNVNYKPPSSSSIVRSQPGALSTNVKPPVQRINTNMNVPGGRIRGGSLSTVLAAFEMKQRMDEGQTATQAGLGAGGAALGGQLGWMAGAKAGALAGAALGSIVPGLGTGVGAAVGAIVGGLAAGYGGAMLGGKLADDLSGVNAAKERMNRGGIGGAIKGGYGLKKQEFKDAPKTMVMTDDKGRPFVGHKAMRGGKLTYVRPPRPGTGTTNPLEALGRFINPGAYKENDQRLAMKNQKIAMVNALENFQQRGMSKDAQARMMKQMGGNLKDVQNDLNYRKKREDQIKQGKLKPNGTPYTAPERMRMSISRSQTRKPTPKPPVKPQPKPKVAGGGMGGRRGSGSSPGSVQRAPSPSPRHRAGTRTTERTTGTKR